MVNLPPVSALSESEPNPQLVSESQPSGLYLDVGSGLMGTTAELATGQS
jgi:hypothetical protein